jgi:hypothetical protein
MTTEFLKASDRLTVPQWIASLLIFICAGYNLYQWYADGSLFIPSRFFPSRWITFQQEPWLFANCVFITALIFVACGYYALLGFIKFFGKQDNKKEDLPL